LFRSDKIDNDGEKTRALVNSLKEQELNRILIERNSELVEERFGRRFFQEGANQNQLAALNSQIQAFQSQLSDTRNSMVNFGTQLGVGQRATSNNVN
jgi:recombinational DNA repair ATPase RecF